MVFVPDIHASLYPNPRTIVNATDAGGGAYSAMMFIFGFVWGLFNLLVCTTFLGFLYDSISVRKATFTAFILSPIAAILILGPFFSPWIARPLAQNVRNCLSEAPRSHFDFFFYRRLGTTAATNTPFKSFSKLTPPMAPFTSQVLHRISKEIQHCTPMKCSNRLQTCGRLVFDLSTLQISHRTKLHCYTPQSQMSLTTSPMTVYQQTVHPARRMQ